MAITKEEILSKCGQELILSRDCNAIADLVSVGRMKPSKIEIGNGTIIEILGDLVVGNALLEHLHTQSTFKYIVPLLDQGRLKLASPLVTQIINSLVPSILTQDQANKLISAGLEPDRVSAQEVADALFNTDGSPK